MRDDVLPAELRGRGTGTGEEAGAATAAGEVVVSAREVTRGLGRGEEFSSPIVDSSLSRVEEAMGAAEAAEEGEVEELLLLAPLSGAGVPMETLREKDDEGGRDDDVAWPPSSREAARRLGGRGAAEGAGGGLEVFAVALLAACVGSGGGRDGGPL